MEDTKEKRENRKPKKEKKVREGHMRDTGHARLV